MSYLRWDFIFFHPINTLGLILNYGRLFNFFKKKLFKKYNNYIIKMNSKNHFSIIIIIKKILKN